MRPCPICRNPVRVCFHVGDVPIGECGLCMHRFAGIEPLDSHLDTVYGDGYFEGGGDGYPDYLRSDRLVTRHARQYATPLARRLRTEGGVVSPGLARPAPRVLDVGAAAGFTLQAFAEAGFDPSGVEPNRRMAAHAREQLGFDLQTGPLEAYEPREGTLFDVVVMVQVLPHFYDLEAALERAAGVTRPGGYWLVETWDWTSRTARSAGQRWHEYSPPSVLQYFSKPSLTKLCRQHGFSPVGSGRPSKRIGFGHARSLLAHKGSPLARPLAFVPAGWSVPYPGRDLFWMLLQKEVSAGAEVASAQVLNAAG